MSPLCRPLNLTLTSQCHSRPCGPAARGPWPLHLPCPPPSFFFSRYLVDRFQHWHPILSLYLFAQGVAFVAFTFATDLPSLVAASMAWGLTSTMPSLSTQAAMTWVWGAEVAPYMQLNNAAFGVGGTLAPIMVSWDLRTSGTFHRTYWAVGTASLLAALLPLCVRSPQRATPGPSSSKGGALNVQTGVGVEEGEYRVSSTGRPPATFYLYFAFYVSTEIGIANWIASFAALNDIVSEDRAALLSAVYYGAFTFTRTAAAPLSRCMSSRRLLAMCLICGCASLAMLIVAQKQKSPELLWIFVATFGCVRVAPFLGSLPSPSLPPSIPSYFHNATTPWDAATALQGPRCKV